MYATRRHVSFKTDDGRTEDGTDRDGRTEDGRRRRDGRLDVRTEDDDGDDKTRWDGRTEDDDGDESKDTTGRTRRDGRTIPIVLKSRIRHWDQDFNVKVSRPREDVSGHAPTFPTGRRHTRVVCHRIQGA